MATITLRKSKFDGIQSVLDKLKASFDDYDASLRELRSTAEGVDSSTCNLADAIDEIASSSEDESEKVEKIQQLNQKIEEFVNTAIRKEQAAKEKIVEKKNDFYKKYTNLKPDPEKSFWERAGDVFCAIGSWIVEHIDIVIAAIIILAAIVVCIVCPAAIIAIIGVIVCAMSAIMGIADLVCMALTGGKDIAAVLAENGHGTLAKIWKGVGIGLDFASIILPVGAGVKTAMTVGGKTFAQASKSLLKETWKSVKNIPKSLKESLIGFQNACKSNGFFRTAGSAAWRGFKSVTGIDDIQNLSSLGKLKNGSTLNGVSIIDNKNAKHWDIDTDNMCMIPKTDEARQALDAVNERLGKDFTSVPLTDANGYIDVKWDEVSIKTLGPDDGFDMKDLGFGKTRDKYDNTLDRLIGSGNDSVFTKGLTNEIYGNKGSRVQTVLNNLAEKTGTKIDVTDIIFHENYDLIHENLVPKQLHEVIGHFGGRDHITQEILKIKYIDRIFVRGTIVGGTNLAAEAIKD